MVFLWLYFSAELDGQETIIIRLFAVCSPFHYHGFLILAQFNREEYSLKGNPLSHPYRFSTELDRELERNSNSPFLINPR